MEKNDKMINRISGRKIHRYLMMVAHTHYKKNGYNVKFEYLPFKNSKIRADVFAKKGNEKIAIECMVKPTIFTMKQKEENYNNRNVKVVLFYPLHFIPTIKLEDYVDEIFKIDIPLNIRENDTTITIKANTWSKLNKRKRLGDTMDDVINRMCLEEPEVQE